VDPAPSASRIGTNAQAKLMKVYPVGPKNLITHSRLRLEDSESVADSGSHTSNRIYYQDHLQVFPLETTIVLLLWFRIGSSSGRSTISIVRPLSQTTKTSTLGTLLFMLATDFHHLYHSIFPSKYNYKVWINCSSLQCSTITLSRS
jgi:hypothetical protein